MRQCFPEAPDRILAYRHRSTKGHQKWVSNYIQSNSRFVVAPVSEKEQHLRIETRLISTVSLCEGCRHRQRKAKRPSDNEGDARSTSSRAKSALGQKRIRGGTDLLYLQKRTFHRLGVWKSYSRDGLSTRIGCRWSSGVVQSRNTFNRRAVSGTGLSGRGCGQSVPQTRLWGLAATSAAWNGQASA